MVGVPVNPVTGQTAGQEAPAPSAHMSDAAKLNFLAKLTDTPIVFGLPMAAGEDFNRIKDLSGDAQMQALRELIGTKEPGQLLDAFEAANPAAKPILDVARSDPNFAAALKDAVVKDPTFLKVMNEKLGAPGSPIDMNAAAAGLQDAQTRANFTEVLKQVAENPNLTGEQAFEVVEAGVAASQNPSDANTRNRYHQAMRTFGLRDNRIEAAGIFAELETDPWGTFLKILQDPQAFADAMKALTGFQDGGMVAGLFNGLAGLTAMWTQDPYVQAFAEHYVPKVQDSVGQDLQVFNGTPAPQRIETANDEARQFANGTPVGPMASLPVTVGGPSFLTGSVYQTAALGAVPAERTQEVGNEMHRNLANNNPSLSMTG